MIYRENPNFVAREIQPNPREVSYWIDLSESPQGQIIKTWVSGKWVKINPSDAEQGGVDLTEVKQAIANLQTNKADKQEVQEVRDQIDEIDLSDYITATEANNKYQVKGNYALKTDIPETDSFITKDEADTAYQEKGYYLTSIPEEYITETKLLAKDYATTSQIPDISTKQDKLVSGTNIKTINNQSVLGQGNIEITTGTGGITDAPADGNMYGRKDSTWQQIVMPDISALATKEELLSKADTEDVESKLDKSVYDADKLTFALKSEIPTDYLTSEDLPDTSNFATKQEVQAKQDTLVSGTNIKTINGASVLGEGNITIETPEGGISDAPQDGKTYGRKDGQWSEITIPDTSALATKTEIADMATQTWVGEQGYLTEHQDISNLATKEELASKANTSDLSNYLTTANASTTYETISGAQSKYQPVGEYALKSEIPSLSGYATESYVNTQVSNLVNSAPATLDTLRELADALGNDANFSTTVTNLIGEKVSTSAYNADKATFALKTEIPTDYLTDEDLNGYVTQTYVTEQLSTKLDVSTYNDEKANFATKDDLQMSGYKINSITINGITGEVTGDIQGDVIKWIRQNSHRYRVQADTEAADGVVIRQLDDSNSRYESYGAGINVNKTRGNNYGTYVKLPKFYYKVIETDTQIYQIDFSIEIQPGDVSWRVYDGNELYSAYSVDYVAGSGNANFVSTPDGYSTEIEYENISDFQSAEGKMFRIMTWQQRCLFYVLYAAWYGSLDIGSNTTSASTSQHGSSEGDGMTDVLDEDHKYNNFWGLENFIRDFQYNYIEDVQMYSYSDYDPEFRIMNGSQWKESIDITGITNTYISRTGLKITEDLIFVPTSNGNNNGVFGSIRFQENGSYQCNRHDKGIFDLGFNISGNDTFGLVIRLTYKGRIREII